jgi:hypothetical protein
VPTPFYHLNLAEEIIAEMSVLPESTHALLEEYRAEFLLGNTAPDVQVISGQTREATHFFTLPLRLNKEVPWDHILALYPALGYIRQIPEAQAAFVAGYLCHLQADYFWVRDIFVPAFGQRSGWETFPRRLYLHNVLRAYLDREILKGLNNGTCSNLARAAPHGWLPFVHDADLYSWRDFLTVQLMPGAKIQTVEVFAARQGILPEEYYSLLGSQERMDQEVFSHLPRQHLETYHQHILEEHLSLLENYLSVKSW